MTGTTKETTMNIIDRSGANPTRRSAVPWWAAFGAPFLGVPLLVGLLALGSPEVPAEPTAPEAGGSFTTDEVMESAPELPEQMVELGLELELTAEPVDLGRC